MHPWPPAKSRPAGHSRQRRRTDTSAKPRRGHMGAGGGRAVTCVWGRPSQGAPAHSRLCGSCIKAEAEPTRHPSAGLEGAMLVDPRRKLRPRRAATGFKQGWGTEGPESHHCAETSGHGLQCPPKGDGGLAESQRFGHLGCHLHTPTGPSWRLGRALGTVRCS